MGKDILVKDIMSTRVVSCARGDSVSSAAKKMRDEDVGSVVIIEGKKPVGILTREDITNKVAAEGKNSADILISEIMNTQVVTISPDDSVSDAAKEMSKHGFRHLPVRYMDKLVGFLSIRDILRVSPGLLDLFKEHFEKDVDLSSEDEITEGDCELCGNYSEELTSVNDRFVCDNCKEEAEGL